MIDPSAALNATPCDAAGRLELVMPERVKARGVFQGGPDFSGSLTPSSITTLKNCTFAVDVFLRGDDERAMLASRVANSGRIFPERSA